MAWQGSTRASRLPTDWPARRQRVRMRAGDICEHVDPETGQRCTAVGSECDHVIPGDDHDETNLQWLCTAHHAEKTRRESAAARWRVRERRPAERHPGLL